MLGSSKGRVFAAVAFGLLGCPSDDPMGSQGTAATGTDGATAGVATRVDTTAQPEPSSGGPPVGPPGEFEVLTYNVAGLPEEISGSSPVEFIPQISPLLNDFDMVLVQEDFWYHDALTAEITLPYASTPWSKAPTLADIGDGLNRFGVHPFADHERTAWYACHGQFDCSSDCLATKGWSVARTTVAEGVEIDVYNLHMEAGGCPMDLEIRAQAARDLVDAITARSPDHAVIVAGDFNLDAEDPEDEEPLRIFREDAQLVDACDAVACDDQRIDHVMVRDGPDLALEVLEWWVPEQFVDAASGMPLSDHLPVAARLRYVPG
ncbi:MAG: hypothetical protein K0V04_41470 [Deltaproteobacteria bacterium]|nr:hypothetical protein [Deltaproteobacteria bacterium]